LYEGGKIRKGGGFGKKMGKNVRQPMPWIKRGGKLTEYSRGIVHGMHLSGMAVTWIAW
jgi:hypothetical protein